MNPVAHTPWRPSSTGAHRGIRDRAARRGHATRRCGATAGVDIGAACGQLAAELAGAPTPAAVARRRELLVDRVAAALARRAVSRTRPPSDTGRLASQIAASILTADFGHLDRVVRKLERAGVDRLHLDVMDGHFVPNITFGPDVVRGVPTADRRCPSTST